jgi:hypothetical protein
VQILHPKRKIQWLINIQTKMLCNFKSSDILRVRGNNLYILCFIRYKVTEKIPPILITLKGVYLTR